MHEIYKNYHEGAQKIHTNATPAGVAFVHAVDFSPTFGGNTLKMSKLEKCTATESGLKLPSSVRQTPLSG